MKIGDEIIGYVRVGLADRLEACTRGWLNSPTHVHDEGDPAFHLSFLPVSTLLNDIIPWERHIMLAGPMACPTGYVLIDQEVVGFDRLEVLVPSSDGLGNPGVTRARLVQIPDHWDSQGIQNGMFGTEPAPHGAEALVYGIPWRYEEGYRPPGLAWDHRLPYYQASWTVRGARWKGIRWDEERPPNEGYLVMHALVRGDGVGEFYCAPGNRYSTVLWDFTAPGLWNKIDYTGVRNEPGRLDARFVVQYLPGSFWPAHSWKRTLKLTRVEVEYDRETRVLFHEEN